MTSTSQAGDPDTKSVRVAVSLAGLPRSGGWFRTQTARRLTFGYALLAPAALYVSLLVAVPFLFSLYLALSDASVGEQVASFTGLENFKAALEMDTFWIALRNSVVFFVAAAILKSILGTSLAFLLLQNFRGKKIVVSWHTDRPLRNASVIRPGPCSTKIYVIPTGDEDIRNPPAS